jgi:hypothetical protein
VISKQAVNKQAPHRNALRNLSRPSEFEIQAFLYQQLRDMGYLVRGEVTTKKGRARFDLVIFSPGKRFPLRIIEVKKRHSRGTGNQVNRYYSEFGVPVDLVGGMDSAREYLHTIPAILSVELCRESPKTNENDIPF